MGPPFLVHGGEDSERTKLGQARAYERFWLDNRTSVRYSTLLLLEPIEGLGCPCKTIKNTDTDLIRRADAVHGEICAKQRELFGLILEIDRLEGWRDCGARDMAHWLSMRYGISDWKARRWIAAAHGLESLPLISEAFSAGELGIDKVVELTRFATPETEEGLLSWACRVSPGAVRRRGNLAVKREACEAKDPEETRYVSWSYFDQGRRFGLEAELPAAQGAVVAKALDRLAGELPLMPEEDRKWSAPARRADALVALCSSRIAEDPDPDRATVVIHASVESLAGDTKSCEIEGGGAISPQTARRLACNARVQVVVEDEGGQPVRLGRLTREPPSWMVRQLRYRDRECVFPSCGSRRFTQAHHVTWWENGGRTDLENLVLTCSFHPPLGARVRVEPAPGRGRDGEVVPSRWDPVSGGAVAPGWAGPRCAGVGS
jgi:hypothetical protein